MSNFKQARKYVISAFLVVILAVSIFAVHVFYVGGNQPTINSTPYVGVAFCGDTPQEAKLLIDRVKNYTNLFVLGTGRSELSHNESSVLEICDYAVANGLSIILSLGINDVANPISNTWLWENSTLDGVKQEFTQRWGNKFLGIYYNDEVGGVQLDGSWSQFFRLIKEHMDQNESFAVPQWFLDAIKALGPIYTKLLACVENGTLPQNYDLETSFFVQNVIQSDPGMQNLTAAGITKYTSDYGLYWYDYLGGYDALFAELGANCSVASQIDMVKGAARLQDKDWGTIITWKYSQSPYLDSGDQIYNQMLTSYQAGAKYIIIFNYPYNDTTNPYGAMTNEHFVALQKFWNDIHQKQFVDLSQPEAVLVLPHNFGWGMRNPNDTIWGFWLSDIRTQQVGTAASKLLTQYGTSLDIIYDDLAYPVSSVNYNHVYWWNSTNI